MKSEETVEREEERRDGVERALLCALFLDKAAIWDVINLLRPEMFTDLNHAFIYAAFVEVYNRGEQPDLTLVALEMKKTDPGRYREAGGIAYLSEGMEDIRLEHNAGVYAREIKRRYILKRAHLLFKQLTLESNQFEADYLAIFERCENELMKLREENADVGSLVPLKVLADESIRIQSERMHLKDDPNRVLSGIYGFDALTGGLYRGEITVLGGLPSDGKTALSMFIAMNVARRGKPVLHFSLEMTGDQTMSRFFAGYGGVEADRLRIGGLRSGDLEKMENYARQIEDLPYYFTNDPLLTLEGLRAEILLKCRQGGCALTVLDYVQLLASAPGKNQTMDNVLSNCMRKLKNIAAEANCAFLVVSQLNRDVTKRVESGNIPMMSDLRDSGSIEQAADVVTIIGHQPSDLQGKKGKAPSDSSSLKLYVLKNRNGASGVVEILHNATYSNFVNPDSYLQFDR